MTQAFADATSLLEGLDPEQREVAVALEGPVAVIAGAGTGKTRAITHRIAYACATGRYNPRAVLAVTFTTRAAGQMRVRLQQLGVPGVQARTFHAAALRQAQYFWPRVYGAPLPEVSEARLRMVAEAAGRARLAIDQAALRDLASEVSWAKASNITVGDYPRLARAAGRTVASLEHEQVARVLVAYEEVKRDRGRIDFDDILLCNVALLADHPEVAEEVRATYRHLVVDEYQDVSPLQHTLLSLWRGDGDSLCVVGDPAQTIHTFAGARASYLNGFAADNPGATVVRLTRDYRSTPQVVDTANRLMQRHGAVTLEAQRPDGPPPSYLEAGSEALEASATAGWLAGLFNKGIPYSEMAVLYRINAQSPAIEAALSQRGIPYLVRGAERFYERAEVRQALVTLRAQAREDGSAAGLEAVREVLGGVGWTPTPPQGAGAVRERWESLSALVGLADELHDDDPSITLEALVAELGRRADMQHVPTAQGVTLSTMHAAKGLEWDAVALYGCHEGSMPFAMATDAEQLAEERRLLYVGITRAREHLHISWSRTRNGQGSPRNPSRFLDGLRPASPSQVGVTPGMRQSRRSALSATCRVCGKGLQSPADRKLGRHEDCPSSYDEWTLARLKAWRSEQAKSQSVPAYCVLTDATLIALAEARPATKAELTTVNGIGARKLERYGDAVLTILRA